jgi:hypothetical protein
MKEPNLQGFDRAKHRCIVYDEIAWGTVIRNTALFQASAEGLHLCQSKRPSDCGMEVIVPCANGLLHERVVAPGGQDRASRLA